MAGDLLPPGELVPDLAMPHYRYNWVAQYDSLAGPWATQFDKDGRERSVDLLDWTRVVRFRLIPNRRGIPSFEVYADVASGEEIRKWWQVTNDPGRPLLVREALGLATTKRVVMLYLYEQNRIVLTTRQDVI